MANKESLSKLAGDAAVAVPTAGLYLVGQNELLRRTSIPLGYRALLAGSVGLGVGFAVGAMGAPRLALGLIFGGGAAALINGGNALNLARYRGQLAMPRAALPAPGATTTTSSTTTTTTSPPTSGLPDGHSHVPAPVTPLRQHSRAPFSPR